MKAITIFLCLLLLGCTSEPLNVRYYLLHTPLNTVNPLSDKTKPVAVLQPLKIADYLRQSSLVLQVDDHELHFSRQDVWAETLQSAFYNALLQDLNSTGQRNYLTSSAPEATVATMAIQVQLDHFHATDTSKVVSSGRYWLTANHANVSSNKMLATSAHSFYFESELTQDGYSHGVKQLRKLIGKLANQIEKDIAAVPNS
ncbi:MAG: ABC-type transport auxiliary lipoprotein family protein [Paraglaciecola sp.]|uniref:PqiC family protein n=1 Tax=Paraglaciecola sp. TaxID=1920173 RepID=UPI003298DB9B